MVDQDMRITTKYNFFVLGFHLYIQLLLLSKEFIARLPNPGASLRMLCIPLFLSSYLPLIPFVPVS